MTALLRTEVLKLTTVRSPWVIVAGAQLLLLVAVSGAMMNGDAADPRLPLGALGHVGLIGLFGLVLGILMMAGEFRHGTITGTFLATPRRDRVVVAKLVVGAGTGLGLAGLSVFTGLAGTWAWARGRGITFDAADSEVWQSLAGATVWIVAFTVIGVGLGAVLRNLAGAVATALAWLALVEGLIGDLLTDAARWLPVALGAAAAQLPGRADPVGPWTAAAVLALYAAAMAGAGAVVTARRDVA